MIILLGRLKVYYDLKNGLISKSHLILDRKIAENRAIINYASALDEIIKIGNYNTRD